MLRHAPALAARAFLPADGFVSLAEELLETVIWVAPERLVLHLDEAAMHLGRVDPADVDYLAAALAVGADAIWSHDRHFDRQSLIPRIERLPA